ncbi:MAG: DNA gyrase modulator, partial [Synergistaceae bacterium]
MKNSEVESLSSWALDEAVRSGAWGADVLYAEGAGFGLSLNDGEVEECVSGSTSGIGIRTIMSDGRQGIAYGNRLDMESVRELVAWSMSN